jgi:hypothetical protein
VLNQGARPVAIGLAAGLAGVVALTRALASLLFGVQPNDLASYVATSALVLGIGLLEPVICPRYAPPGSIPLTHCEASSPLLDLVTA